MSDFMEFFSFPSFFAEKIYHLLIFPHTASKFLFLPSDWETTTDKLIVINQLTFFSSRFQTFLFLL